MARTQAPDYEQRREAILEHAADLFARQGFQGTSVSDLARACQTSKSLFYHYYPSKEDVLYAVMSSHIDLLVSDVETASALKVPAPEKLDALIHAFMRHYAGASSRQKVLLNELGNLPNDRRRDIIKKQRFIIEAAQKLLVETKEKLAADPVRAKAETMLLFGMINWTHTWFDPSGPLSADEIADMAMELVNVKE